MRTLLVHPGPMFSVADVYAGWRDALAGHGHVVQEFNLGERLMFFGNAFMERDGEYEYAFETEAAIDLALMGIETACYRLWPDLIVIISGFYMTDRLFEILRARNHRILIVHTESPYEDDKQLHRAQYADLNVINDPTNIDRFTEAAKTIYLPQAYDPKRHHPRRRRLSHASDFFFCGTCFESRVKFLEACDFDGINVRIGGFWVGTEENSPIRGWMANPIDESMPNEETQRWYTSTKASMNLYRREANRPELEEGWSMGPREVELAASGTFFLREPRGEGDEVLSMLPTFESPEDFSEQLRWWLDNDYSRACAAKKARFAVQDRTFANHVATALRTLGL